jgi:hypothetical protein
MKEVGRVENFIQIKRTPRRYGRKIDVWMNFLPALGLPR